MRRAAIAARAIEQKPSGSVALNRLGADVARAHRRAVEVGPGAAASEVAIGETQPRNRAAERHLAGAVDIEAGLEREAAQRGAVTVALHLQGSGGQHDLAPRAAAAD